MLTRRLFAFSGAALPFASTWGQEAEADYPRSPVTIVIPFTAGGPTDTVARIVGEQLSRTWKQPVLMDYRAGANTMVAASYVAKAKPDGHTLGLVVPALLLNPLLRKSVPYKMAEFVALAQLTTIPSTVAAAVNAPFNTIPEMVAYSKTKADGLSFGTAGTGGAAHLCGEQLKKVSGARITHIPYKGFSQQSTDLIGGQIDMMIDGLPAIVPLVQGGKLKVIGVSAPHRLPQFPDFPAIAESLPGFEVQAFFGLVAPAATPAATVQKISDAVLGALNSQRARIEALGLTVAGLGAHDFGSTLQRETEQWRSVIRDARIQLDE